MEPVSSRPGGRGRGLATRLTLVILLVTALGMAVMGLYVARAIERHLVDDLRGHLVTQARLIRDAGAAIGWPDFARAYGARLGTRVTVVARDGTVLGDSEREPPDLATMENHAARPEVQAALAGQVGFDIRRSRTLALDMLYVAVPLESGPDAGGGLRLALPMPEVARSMAWARRAVVAGGVLALGLALVVGLVVSRHVSRPVAAMTMAAQRMAAGEFGAPLPVHGSDEVAELGRALGGMAGALRERIAHLQSERAKVAAILDGMMEGVIALDGRSRILFMNPAARTMFAIPPGAVEGRPLLELIRQKALYDFVEAARAAGAVPPLARELDLPPPADRVVTAHASAGAFVPEGAGTLLVLHDVTELRRLERVRTEFVANVSHELRTPLTAIRGYLETLLDGALDEPAHARGFLQIAHAHAERLSRLVDDLLQLSNLEQGRVTLHLQPVPLREVGESVLAIAEPEAARRGVTLTHSTSLGLAVTADRDRLAQVLVNLVDNAVKFTPAGGQVTLSAAPAPGARVEVSVADTGIGIPSTDLPRITERFYRVDKARSREEGGTGLGLAIVKHLVQAHGGDLAIESDIGRGTRVQFTLPAA